MLFFVVATGQSIKGIDIDRLRHYHCVAVSNAYELMPWADALVSTDRAWWDNNKDAKKFKGRKFSVREHPWCESLGAPTNHNSGLLGIRAAIHLGAKRIILLGFDMYGTHYFGNHPKPLRNPNAIRFEVFKRDIARYKLGGVQVYNANKESGLHCYPKVDVELADGSFIYPPFQPKEKPLVCSFYTQDWDYPKYAARLLARCEELGVPCVVSKIESKGSYLKNTCQKPAFILECLERFKRPIFWVDVDTEINVKPGFNFDIAHIGAVRVKLEKHQYNHHVGCLYFNYTEETLNFVREWVEATGARSDHLSFNETYKKYPHFVEDLPEEYGSFKGGIFEVGVSKWAGKASDAKELNNPGAIKAWWATTPKPGNLGDILTPYIVSKLTGRKVQFTQQKSAKLIAVGSIARLAPAGCKVWGSGAMRIGDKYNPRAIFHAVRGPITRQELKKQNISCPEVYGDPALLLPLFYQPSHEKKHALGIIPHYVDKNFVKNEGHIIDVLTSDIEGFINQVASCEKIISSSLHGVIVAHAYGVPVAWVQYSDKLTGDGTKFADYAESVGIKLEPQGAEIKVEDLVFVEPGKIDLLKLLKAFPYPFEQKWIDKCRSL